MDDSSDSSSSGESSDSDDSESSSDNEGAEEPSQPKGKPNVIVDSVVEALKSGDSAPPSPAPSVS